MERSRTISSTDRPSGPGESWLGTSGTMPARLKVPTLGLKPNTDFLKGVVRLTKDGFIDAPGLSTSMRGVFAAGDARAGSTKQVASAVGEGAAAALAVRHYLEEIGEARHVEVEMMSA